MVLFSTVLREQGTLRRSLFALLTLVGSCIGTAALACPNPNQNGQMLTYTGQQLWAPQTHGVTAGGSQNLSNCPGVPGHGRVTSSPDFTLNLTANPQNYALEFRLTAQCDTVLLVRSPNGQWHYNDDTNGFNPLIRLNNAQAGQYRIWAGTFGQGNCAATLALETFGGGPTPFPLPLPIPVPPLPIPPLPPLAACPNPGMNGQMLTYTGQQLWAPQTHGVTAGGTVNLSNCGNIPGHGRVTTGPDFTLNLTANPQNYALEFRLTAQCDTVLLVNGPNGQWHYNDDTNGFNPLIRLNNAQPGV